MNLTLLRWIEKLAERFGTPDWAPAALRRAVAGTTRAMKQRFHVRVAKRAVSGRLANLDDIEHFLCERYVPVHAPLLLVSQVQRSGGSLLSQLFDGHPAFAAYPQELRFGHKAPDRWPEIDTSRGPRETFFRLFDHNFPRMVRRGLTKGYRNPDRHPFMLITRVEYAIFRTMWESSPPRGERDVMDCFFTAFYNGWLNYRGDLERSKWVAAFAPRLAREESSAARFFEAYPDGRLIQIVRDPMTWYPSAKNHAKTGAARIGRERIIGKWARSAESILRNKKQFGDRVVVLRFEDLVGRTEPTMRELCARLEVAFDPVLLEPTFNGHPMRANSSFAVETTGVIAAPLARAQMLSREEIEFLKQRCGAVYDDVIASSIEIAPKPPLAAVQRR